MSGDWQGLLDLANGFERLLAAAVRPEGFDSRRMSGLAHRLSSRPSPGTWWAPLLKPGGSLTAILGYRDKAPYPDEGSQIAALMGQKIATGLHPDQWVQVWLGLHVNSTMKRWPEFRNAVGMDEKRLLLD